MIMVSMLIIREGMIMIWVICILILDFALLTGVTLVMIPVCMLILVVGMLGLKRRACL